ncbi:hypothetical protein [Dethiobacter alkaliphilus]|uniref:hypothetical protein n=1 Tax=Dethiobacter alkaliphilus TaxID=427926 RepID=UPI002226BE86|nr:hypothetical protein [Dethiobacter alkaliphilus]MCW3490806.1 hypothetical protein [Dethiobacter alkaliphilus]
MKNLKWPVIVLAFVVTLALGVGGVYLRQHQMVDEPLFQRLSEYEPVQAVDLHKDGNQQVVVVTLDYVDDFGYIHRRLKAEIVDLLGENGFRLEIRDGRDPRLETAFSAVNLALYEGEQRGNFTEMGQQVEAALADLGIAEHKIMVDNENIYLQIRQDDAYLYEIIERGNRGKEGERA